MNGFHTFLYTVIYFYLFYLDKIIAEEECLYGKILCYECESNKNPGCGDPFNYTSVQTSKMCHGCCVKIVMKRGTSEEHIRRTCTKELEINLFMVDHVCMEASNGQGHMCFCENSNCNSAFKLNINLNSLKNLLSVLFIYLYLYILFIF